jgi:hypothetical protein
VAEVDDAVIVTFGKSQFNVVWGAEILTFIVGTTVTVKVEVLAQDPFVAVTV